MESRKIAVLGAGKAGEALIAGLLSSGWREPAEIAATARHEERLAELAERYGIATTTSNIEAADGAGVVVIAVKPQDIERLLAERSRIFDMTLMLQKEVVQRITSAPGSRDYGYLSVLVQYHCATSKLFDVPASAFKPAPKVDSAVVRLTFRERPAVEVDDEAKFFAVVRACFAQRRKTILNNLKAAASQMTFTSPTESALRAAGVEPRRRAETLSLVEFGALADALYRSVM